MGLRCTHTILVRISAPPIPWVIVSVSSNPIQPMQAAMSGFKAANNPALSALVYFWANGWKVKPKTEHIKTKANISSQVDS